VLLPARGSLLFGVSAPWFKRDSEEDDMKVDCNRWLIGVATGLVMATLGMFAQEGQRTVFRVKVDMVVLSFTVTDSKGHYVNGLKPGDFRILEDGIVEKIVTFGEGSKPPVAVLEDGSTRPLIGVESRDGSIKPGFDPALTPSLARTFLFSSIPATTCTAALSMPRTRLPTSFAVWTAPTPSPCTRSAATFLALLC
jgi:hypothetical protein